MTEDELWDYLDGFHAYDSGCTDSGISDPLARQQVIEQLSQMTKDEIRLFLSRCLRDDYLSEEALAAGYGVEDVASFWDWISNDVLMVDIFP